MSAEIKAKDQEIARLKAEREDFRELEHDFDDLRAKALKLAYEILEVDMGARMPSREAVTIARELKGENDDRARIREAL